VALTDQATRLTKQTTTGSEGFYHFSEVAPGKYTVTVEAKGFSRKRDRRCGRECRKGLVVLILSYKIGAMDRGTWVGKRPGVAPRSSD